VEEDDDRPPASPPARERQLEEEQTALLRLWKNEWRAAGWDPVVLTRDDLPDATSLPRVAAANDAPDDPDPAGLDKWKAMAQVGGGSYASVHVYPLTLPTPPLANPHDNVLTLHERVAPTLLSGTAAAWARVGSYLRDHWRQSQRHARTPQQAQQQDGRPSSALAFWTDTLGLLALLDEQAAPPSTNDERSDLMLRVAAHVASPRAVVKGADDCVQRPLRAAWAVHVGARQAMLLTGVPDPEWRLPGQRHLLAHHWMAQWYAYCGLGYNATATPTS
jgi:hypothetical protein